MFTRKKYVSFLKMLGLRGKLDNKMLMCHLKDQKSRCLLAKCKLINIEEEVKRKQTVVVGERSSVRDLN